MPGRITTIEPQMDLGEYLNKIKTEYAAKGLGISLLEPNELGMLMEKDLVNAGLVDTRTYKAQTREGSSIPVIVRSTDYEKNLNYKILKINPQNRSVKEYLDDNAKELLVALLKAGADAYRGAAFEREDSLYLVLGGADDEGNIFEDDVINRLEKVL